MLLNELLDPEQVRDIHFLAKQREWTSLLALIRKMHNLAKDELAMFVTPDQAIERRGKVNAIKNVLDAIQSSYDEVHKSNDSSASSRSPEGDDTPKSFAY